MRVPMFPADLLPKQGFSRIAKKLQRNWVGDVPLSLSSAQEMLSRGLGYRDFYDLQQSVKNTIPTAVLPAQNEVRDSISTSIFASFQAKSGPYISEEYVERLVELLPLQELLVFQVSSLSRTASPISSSAASEDISAPGESVDEAREPDHAELNARQSAPPEGFITEAGLRSIWEAVQRKGNLRDQCLFALLRQGMRASELRAVRRSDISKWNAGQCMLRLKVTKTRGLPLTMPMPISFLTLVDKYVQHMGLSEDDLLFSSSRDPSVPMNSWELSKVIGSYLRDALTDPALRTAHMIRKSVVAQMGHESRSTTLDFYMAGLPKKSED